MVSKLFIICPIGSKKSAVRLRSEGMKRILLEPAIARVQAAHGIVIEAEIDHHDSGARDIVQGIVNKLISYEFIVAFVYNTNPNVFYELGVAHSAGRDVVILMQEEADGRPLPFDIQTRSAITYATEDMDGWLRGEGKEGLEEIIQRIANALEKAMSDTPRERKAFGSERLDPLGSRNQKYVLHERFTESLPYNSIEAMEFYEAAESYMALMGVSLYQLGDPGDAWKTASGVSVPFLEFLEGMLAAKPVNLDIFIMHPDNPALPQMLKSFVNRVDEADHQLVRVRDEIAAATNQWRLFIDRVNSRNLAGRASLIRLKRGIPYNRLSLTDRALIATPYFYRNTTSGTGPAGQARHKPVSPCEGGSGVFEKRPGLGDLRRACRGQVRVMASLRAVSQSRSSR